jgi:asparaginyl-tRNA synthetase
MLRPTVRELLSGAASPGSAVTVQGWVRTRRDSKAGISFLAVSDGSCFATLQVVAGKELPNYESEILRLTAGCSVVVQGELVATPGRPQPVEVRATGIEVLGWVEDPETYPIQPKQHSMEFLRTVAHLRPRTNTFGAVARVRHTLAMAVHRFFDRHQFFWVHTPILTTSDAEGAGEMFRVSTLDLVNVPKTPGGEVDFSQDFFGRQAALTVSGQLNVEAYCEALSRVYTFGPTFRAENSNTSRHLAEFWMIEPEVAFADLSADADLAEAFLRNIYRAILEERGPEMEFFEERVQQPLRQHEAARAFGQSAKVVEATVSSPVVNVGGAIRPDR